MLKKNEKITMYIVAFIVILSFLISIYVYPKATDEIPSHWNIKGEVDDYSSKPFGLFLMPVILGVIGILFLLIPNIDPLKKNIESFRKYFDILIILFLIFILMIHIQIILWTFGTRISPNIYFPVGIGILFSYIGFMLKKTKRNWFIGIRTPWTLTSDVVWEKTHNVGSVLFMISGAISLLGVAFPDYTLLFVLIPIISSAIFLFMYSYYIFKKNK